MVMELETDPEVLAQATAEINDLHQQMRRCTYDVPIPAVICVCGQLITEAFCTRYGRAKAVEVKKELFALIQRHLLRDMVN
jgi:hypothetical protein